MKIRMWTYVPYDEENIGSALGVIWRAEVTRGRKAALLELTARYPCEWQFLPNKETAPWWLRVCLWWKWLPFERAQRLAVKATLERLRQLKAQERWVALPAAEEPEPVSELPEARVVRYISQVATPRSD